MDGKIIKTVKSTTNAKTTPHHNGKNGIRTVRATRTVTIKTITKSVPVVTTVETKKEE
ncbi:MAG: hypothetical protein WCJ46_03690 [bacterium]